MLQTCVKCPETKGPQNISNMASHLRWHKNMDHVREGIHEPDTWILVVTEGPLVLQAMCKCGKDDCYFTATVYEVYNNWTDTEGNSQYMSRKLRDFQKE